MIGNGKKNGMFIEKNKKTRWITKSHYSPSLRSTSTGKVIALYSIFFWCGLRLFLHKTGSFKIRNKQIFLFIIENNLERQKLLKKKCYRVKNWERSLFFFFFFFLIWKINSNYQHAHTHQHLMLFIE